MGLPAAICGLSEAFFQANPTDAEIAVRMIREPSELLRQLLTGNNVVTAGRLIGAYSFLGETKIADQIKQSMAAGGNVVRVSNPFQANEPALDVGVRFASPQSGRIQAMWSGMRVQVLEAFQGYPSRDITADAYLAEMEERYESDAYNSLSIEGYRVTPELIQRVRTNKWNPDTFDSDKQEPNALDARGYYQAFQNVKRGITKILTGANSADVIDQDFQDWYREMFSPAVLVGLLQANQLAGYRNSPVYLRGSRHVPPSADAVVDCMEAFASLMRNEAEPVVQAILGHYAFVYIHPFSDGNGRIGRFIMNAAFASGGFPWTVIRQIRRAEYLAALEEASLTQNLRPFADFVRQEMQALDDGLP